MTVGTTVGLQEKLHMVRTSSLHKAAGQDSRKQEPESIVVLTLVLDVVEVFPVDTLEILVTDSQHLVERESEVGAMLVVASQRHDVVVGELVTAHQAPHQATELVERHAD